MPEAVENQHFNSPIFGETRHATEEEAALIADLVKKCPVAVFQQLNAAFGQRGLVSHITARDRASSPSYSVLERVHPGEPIFVLRAQDITADGLVDQWVNRAAKRGCPEAKVAGARLIAEAFRLWPKRKLPD